MTKKAHGVSLIDECCASLMDFYYGERFLFQSLRFLAAVATEVMESRAIIHSLIHCNMKIAAEFLLVKGGLEALC